MSVLKVCLVLSTVMWSVASVDEDQLKEAARDFYMQQLQATSDILPDISTTRLTFSRLLGLEMHRGHISGTADKTIDKLSIFKRKDYYVVIFDVKINHLECSYGMYQHRPKGGVSACSGSWSMENIKNDVQVTLVLDHHSWTEKRSQCKVSLERVEYKIDTIFLDKGSHCKCCDTYDKSVKESLEKKLNYAVEDYLFNYYQFSHNWKGSDIIPVDCMINNQA